MKTLAPTFLIKIKRLVTDYHKEHYKLTLPLFVAGVIIANYSEKRDSSMDYQSSMLVESAVFSQ